MRASKSVRESAGDLGIGKDFRFSSFCTHPAAGFLSNARIRNDDLHKPGDSRFCQGVFFLPPFDPPARRSKALDAPLQAAPWPFRIVTRRHVRHARTLFTQKLPLRDSDHGRHDADKPSIAQLTTPTFASFDDLMQSR